MKRRNLTGWRFGHLTAIEPVKRPTDPYHTYWQCRCDCGSLLTVRTDNLTTGHSTKCSGCVCRGGTPSIFVEGVVDNGVV